MLCRANPKSWALRTGLNEPRGYVKPLRLIERSKCPCERSRNVDMVLVLLKTPGFDFGPFFPAPVCRSLGVGMAQPDGVSCPATYHNKMWDAYNSVYSIYIRPVIARIPGGFGRRGYLLVKSW